MRRTKWVGCWLVALMVALAVGNVTPAAGQTPSLNWIALGDSYAAGVGLGDVTKDCDRDPGAYAPRANRDLLAGRSINIQHIACTGSTTGAMNLVQAPLVNSTHKIATVTIGGNDIGFADKVGGCWTQCGDDTLTLSADTKDPTTLVTWDGLFNQLVGSYTKIRQRMAADGVLYVISYPIPFSRSSQASCDGLDANEQNAANALVTRLDDTIYHAVARANEQLQKSGRAGNVVFLDWRTGTRVEGGYTIPARKPGAGQRFATYTSPDGRCATGRTPFLNGYVGWAPVNGNRNNSFHPTSTGYWYAANLVAGAISSRFPLVAAGGPIVKRAAGPGRFYTSATSPTPCPRVAGKQYSWTVSDNEGISALSGALPDPGTNLPILLSRRQQPGQVTIVVECREFRAGEGNPANWPVVLRLAPTTLTVTSPAATFTAPTSVRRGALLEVTASGVPDGSFDSCTFNVFMGSGRTANGTCTLLGGGRLAASVVIPRDAPITAGIVANASIDLRGVGGGWGVSDGVLVRIT